MEQQLSNLSMVPKPKKGKKTVSFEKNVSFSDDPPPVPASILSKKDRDRSSDRGSSSIKNSYSKTASDR